MKSCINTLALVLVGLTIAAVHVSASMERTAQVGFFFAFGATLEAPEYDQYNPQYSSGDVSYTVTVDTTYRVADTGEALNYDGTNWSSASDISQPRNTPSFWQIGATAVAEHLGAEAALTAMSNTATWMGQKIGAGLSGSWGGNVLTAFGEWGGTAARWISGASSMA